MIQQQKIIEWTERYLKHIQSITIPFHVTNEEGYKFVSVDHFQKNFDLNATDLHGMLDQALLNNNLVTGAQYFPRKMLLIYAQHFPDRARDILEHLYNESIDVSDRITETEEEFRKLNEERDKLTPGKFSNTYIGLRFLSLLLSYRYPDKYNALKPSEWKFYSRFINPEFKIPNKTASGKHYVMYSEYIEPLRLYISTRNEFKEIKDALTRGLSFSDSEYRWMAQDIIYVTAKLIAEEKTGVLQNNKAEIIKDTIDVLDDEEILNNTGFMPLEKHLEEYIVKNWDIIDFGEKLSIYYHEDGTTGQQYTTDVGIIDILAVDSNQNFVVIEMKRADAGYDVVGQILNYMGWVQDNLTENGRSVRGMIIVGSANNKLKSAIKMVGDKIFVKEYRMQMTLEDVKRSNL